MRKNFTCKFNGYVTPDNREGVIQSIVSQLQSYDCDPEVTLTDDGIIVSATINGDLTPSLLRDKLAFNYFITSVSTGDTIRKIKKMVLPKTEAAQFKNVSPFVDPRTLDERVTSTLDLTSAGPARSFTIGDQEYMLGSRELTSSWVKQADPTSDMLPGIFTGDGPKDEFIIDGATEIKPEDVNGEPSVARLFGGSKLGASVGDANGPSLGLYSLPHETVSVEDSVGAAPEGTGLPRFDSIISDPGPVAIPNTSLNSGFHDRTILNPVGKPRAESLGVPMGATPSLGLAAFRRIGLEDKIETALDIPTGAGGSGITNIINQPITDWSTRPQTASKIFLGLSDDFDDEDESDDEDEF